MQRDVLFVNGHYDDPPQAVDQAPLDRVSDQLLVFEGSVVDLQPFGVAGDPQQAEHRQRHHGVEGPMGYVRGGASEEALKVLGNAVDVFLGMERRLCQDSSCVDLEAMLLAV